MIGDLHSKQNFSFYNILIHYKSNEPIFIKNVWNQKNAGYLLKVFFPLLAQSHGIEHKMDLYNLSLKMTMEFPNTRAKERKGREGKQEGRKRKEGRKGLREEENSDNCYSV